MPFSQTLSKEERLYGKLVISSLFDHGHVFYQSPYKVVWTRIPESCTVRVRFAISVPKRFFKHAVKRNLVKRRTREAFRMNKQILNDVSDGQIHLMVIYTSVKILSFTELENSMKKILLHISQQVHAESY